MVSTPVSNKHSDRLEYVSLRILATTDLHMHILPYDYLSDESVNGWGLSNTAHLIQAARDEVDCSILLDNGDFLHGSVLSDLVTDQYTSANAANERAFNPIIAVMNELNYDLGNLGNHDFDRGVAFLFDAIEQANFPFLSANVVRCKGASPTQDSTLVRPFSIVSKTVQDQTGKPRELKIGVIGFLPPASLKLGAATSESLTIRDIVECAQAFVPFVKEMGADIVVALAHSGIGAENHVEGMENALIPLSKVEGVDVIIGGHTHQVFPEPDEATTDPNGLSSILGHIPTVIPGFWGSHLGVVDLCLAHDGTAWSLQGANAQLRSVAQELASQNPPVTKENTSSAAAMSHMQIWLDCIHKNTQGHMSIPVAKCDHWIENHLALVGAENATWLVQNAMQDFAHDFQKRYLKSDLPVLASSSPFKAGGLAGPNYYSNVAAGPITMRSLSDLYVFPNQLALMQVSGAFLRLWLERAASGFCQVTPNSKIAHLKDNSTPGYLFESVLGVTYKIDLTQPAHFSTAGEVLSNGGRRITELCHDGRPVADDDQFLMASNDFRIRGGGGFPAINDEQMIDLPELLLRDVLKEYVKNKGNIRVESKPVWTFVPIKGTKLRFHSSPEALKASELYPWLTIRCINQDDIDGFALYEMTF